LRKKYLGDSGTDIGFPMDPNSETGPEIDPSLFLDLKVVFSLKLNKTNKIIVSSRFETKYLGDMGTDSRFPTDPNSEIDPSLYLGFKSSN
jgi:hypothetical protein